jgi:hypothetical protein
LNNIFDVLFFYLLPYLIMKKSLLSLAGIGLGLMFGLVVNAQED